MGLTPSKLSPAKRATESASFTGNVVKAGARREGSTFCACAVYEAADRPITAAITATATAMPAIAPGESALVWLLVPESAAAAATSAVGRVGSTVVLAAMAAAEE